MPLRKNENKKNKKIRMFYFLFSTSYLPCFHSNEQRTTRSLRKNEKKKQKKTLEKKLNFNTSHILTLFTTATDIALCFSKLRKAIFHTPHTATLGR
jgi:hypothetical protein